MKPLAVAAPVLAMSLVLLVANRIDAQSSSPSDPPPAVPPSPFAADANTYAPRYGEKSRPLKPGGPGSPGSPGSYVLPFYVTGDTRVNVESPEAQRPAAIVVETLGRLFLNVEPATAQVLVDGIVAGTVADFRGTGLLLPVGLRRVELRAPGFEGATFDINIVVGQPARYRGDLPAVRRIFIEPAAPTTRRGPDTFYVIPGCYAGNRPPRERSLPRGCNIARTRAITGT